ncbi:fungal-specific transcription factor domain-containing protein [Chlamydoabsidia padenii]|nr:fungal-specific transcription factor domain-containing protein [Chlamydoabsidia padenii]
MDHGLHQVDLTQLTATGDRRKRLVQACLVCRRKKTKCDGVKPTCGNCKRLKQTCSYGSLQRKPSARQTHINILEQRLQEMEKRLAETRERSPPTPRLSFDRQDSSTKMSSYKIITNRYANDGTTLPPIHVGQCLTNDRNHHKVIDMDRQWLPCQQLLDKYIQCYLNRIYGVSPFFYTDDLMVQDKTPVVVLMAIAAGMAKYAQEEKDNTPLWMAGEPFAEKIRSRINDIVDMPSISHVQVMMFLIMHEFGCARGTRAWMYCGIAGRMVLELGLQKEPTHLFEDGKVMSVETWKKNELRRNVFWGMYIYDRFGGASSARPVLFNDNDIDCHLPCHENCLEQNTFSSESLDGTQLLWYQVVERDEKGLAKSIKLVETVSQDPLARSRCNLGWPTHMIRIISLFAKVANFVHRTMAKSNSPQAPYDSTCYKDYCALTDALDLWCHQLPLNMRNTPANLQRYRSEKSRDTHRFSLSHILYNALVVFLNRPALTLIDNLDNLGDLSASQMDRIQLGVEKCQAASDNVSIMLTDINRHAKLVFSFLSYLTYSTATVVVHTLFTGTADESKKAAVALKSHCEFLQNMRKYYAMADIFFFRIRDFYDLYKTQTRQESSTNSASKVDDDTFTQHGNNDMQVDAFEHLLDQPLHLLLSAPTQTGTINWPLDDPSYTQHHQHSPNMHATWPFTSVDDMLYAPNSNVSM